jgi:hypothetical protein
MPRTKGSKNKNINTAKNKNIININVNSSKSRKGRGRPKKQSNDTTQYRQSGGMGGMAPPQVIISQPQPDNSNNSLLSSFITSKLLNESMNQNRTNMTNVEQPSYFNARDSIIPKLPETPISKPPVIKPADITPSTIIKTREPIIPEPEPRKIDIKPDEVAPPTTGRHLYKKLKDTASKVTDAASSELGTSIIEHALNGIDNSHVASTLVGTALRAHRNRKQNTMDADEEIKQNEIKQLRELHKKQNRSETENNVYNTLKTKFTGIQPKSPPKATKEMIDASGKLKSATKTKLYSKEYNDIVKEKRAANKIESAMQSKQYSNELKQVLAVNKNLGPAIKQAVTRNKYIKARDRYLDKKEQNKLDTMEAQVGYIENVVKKADGIQNQNKAISTLSNAIKLRKARKEFIDAQNTYDPRKHQQNIREKRKEFTRIITTQTTSKQAKDDAKKQFKKTDYVFKRKSNAGRPPKNGAQENEF